MPPLIRPSAVDDAGDAVRQVIRAYHGSPHNFDRFDASKIGAGEGAQAYGHGLYFAGNENVARSYRDIAPSLLPPERIAAAEAAKSEWERALQAWEAADTALSQAHAMRGSKSPGWGDIVAAPANDPEIARLTLERNRWQRALDEATERQNVAQFGRQRGHMYEVEIGHPESALLDWDRPLKSQGAFVEERLAPFRSGKYDLDPRDGTDIETGETALHRIAAAFDDDMGEASAALFKAGIPGIKYWDAGSRSARKGTRNYVMFPGTEDQIRILRKYGLLAPIPAAAAMSGGTED